MISTEYRLSNFIKPVESFQYAINLKYDIKSIDKVKNYIATTSAIDVIEDILLSVNPNSNDRARILIGPYGKGKSHLVLVMVALLYYKDKKIFENLLNKIKEYKPDLYDLAISILESKEKMLPVIVSGTSLDVAQSLLVGLKAALEEEGLDDIMPNTYFNAAIDMIKLWESDYRDTFKKFIELIDVPNKEFIYQLSIYNQGTYDRFVEIYPQLTSGSEFNPMQGIDVVDLFEDVANKITKRGYKGLFIVYDEFSKFLEGSIHKNSSMDIKLLQDLAEKCNRSKEEQLHILLISHKSIGNYVDKLPKEKIDAWKAVENRFKSVEINYLESQTYEIMSQVILKDREAWEDYKEEYRKEFKQLALDISRSGIFDGINSLEEHVIYGNFPLHPITTYILPKISEKVAQNERTIFTFLSSSELNTLEHFIRNNSREFSLMTADYIYDYFENLFKKENYNSEIYQIWRQTRNALDKLDDNATIEHAIIKTIALINILGENQKLRPTIELLKMIYIGEYASETIDDAINRLLDKKVLYFVKSKGYLKLIEATDVDINALINDELVKRQNLFSSKKTLNHLLDDKYLYPNRYNSDYEIIRYFDVEFITFEELKTTRNWDKKIEDKSSDGTLYAVMLESIEEYKGSIEIIKEINHKRIIFILPKKLVNIDDLLRRYDAIEFLIGKNQHEGQDPLLHEELLVYLDDIKLQIQDYIDMFLKPEKGEAKYFYLGNEQKINRKAALSHLLSSICEEVFYKTPIIINELINCNEPTTVAISNRRKVLDGLLKDKLVPRLGLTGYGLDVSIMQATLNATEILIDNDDEVYIRTEGLEDKIQNVLNIIDEFILSTSKNGPQPFSVLYEKLTRPEHGIGLKKGVIPIYIAVILRKYKHHSIILRNGQEIECRPQLLDDINERPSDYEIYLEDWNADKERYIKYLESIFEADARDKEYNSFKYVFNAIHRWFLSLPNYTKEYSQAYLGQGEFKKVSKEIIMLRNNLRGLKINAREFIFEKLIKILGHDDINDSLLADIKRVKEELDLAKINLIKSLVEDIKALFSTKDNLNQSLSSIMKDWYSTLEEDTKINLFSNGEERFIKEVELLTNDYYSFIEKVAVIVTGLRIDDWNDDTVTVFINRIHQFKETIEGFNNKTTENGNTDMGYYRITYFADEKEVTKSFEKKESLSQKAMYLYNELESLMEDYSTVDINEKRQVLLEIFRKI